MSPHYFRFILRVSNDIPKTEKNKLVEMIEKLKQNVECYQQKQVLKSLSQTIVNDLQAEEGMEVTRDKNAERQ